MFEKLKATTIVRRMILDAESLIGQAKQEGHLTSNYYLRAECALLSLAILFADIYTKKDKLGKAIVKESISGYWRKFFSENQKQEYKNQIESLVSLYKIILQSAYSSTFFVKFCIEMSRVCFADCIRGSVYFLNFAT